MKKIKNKKTKERKLEKKIETKKQKKFIKSLELECF
jgi:hypothetical protein